MPKAKNEHRGYRGITSDFSIIDRALTGEQLAYEELFKKYREKFFNFFMRKTSNNNADSEDMLQDTFVSAFCKLHTFKKNASFYTWLYSIAVNVFLMSCRHNKLRFVSIDELGVQQIIDRELVVETSSDKHTRSDKKSEIGNPDHALENVPNKITVNELLNGLPPGYRRMLILRDLQGLEYKEVAAKLRCSLGNAKPQRHRAIMKLRATVQTAHVPISTNPTLNN